MEDPKPLVPKTFAVRLTRFELLHLRDLFSIMLPTDLKQTVSQALALAEERPMVEARLWQKLVEAIGQAGLPTGHEAPDFVCAASTVPSVGVFRMATEPAPQEADAGAAFVAAQEE
jgi:hypothetical protein